MPSRVSASESRGQLTELTKTLSLACSRAIGTGEDIHPSGGSPLFLALAWFSGAVFRHRPNLLPFCIQLAALPWQKSCPLSFLWDANQNYNNCRTPPSSSSALSAQTAGLHPPNPPSAPGHDSPSSAGSSGGCHRQPSKCSRAEITKEEELVIWAQTSSPFPPASAAHPAPQTTAAYAHIPTSRQLGLKGLTSSKQHWVLSTPSFLHFPAGSSSSSFCTQQLRHSACLTSTPQELSSPNPGH